MKNGTGTEKHMVPVLKSSIWEYSTGTLIIRRIL